MKTTNTFISEVDFERILQLIENLPRRGSYPHQLEKKINDMEVVEPSAIPNDLITMNSEISCTVNTLESNAAFPKRLRLVYPNEARLELGYVSVLSPLGTALLGARAGLPVTWQGRDGTPRTIQLNDVIYQPEANGDWQF